jgi:hypothetical protein
VCMLRLAVSIALTITLSFIMVMLGKVRRQVGLVYF